MLEKNEKKEQKRAAKHKRVLDHVNEIIAKLPPEKQEICREFYRSRGVFGL